MSQGTLTMGNRKDSIGSGNMFIIQNAVQLLSCRETGHGAGPGRWQGHQQTSTEAPTSLFFTIDSLVTFVKYKLETIRLYSLPYLYYSYLNIHATLFRLSGKYRWAIACLTTGCLLSNKGRRLRPSSGVVTSCRTSL